MQENSKIPVFIRILTAALLGFGAARFVARYDLIEFTGASALTFAFLSVSYFLLSRKYETALHALFLALAIVVAYKAFRLQPFDSSSGSNERIVNRLSVAATLLTRDKIRSGQFPDAARANTLLETPFPDEKWDYCRKPCRRIPTQNPEDRDGFWLSFASKNSRDKAPTVWYIDDALEVFTTDSSGKDFRNFSLEPIEKE